ncbi:MAG: tetraacyldisaccharide 4'-kinase [Planctomycetota bacterium]
MSAGLFRFHRAVISPDRRGPLLALARGGLRLAAAGYGLGIRARNGLHGLGWARAHGAGVPVISVGNITAGGTGKTPFVAWLARLMVIRKMRPAILSRGYGRHNQLGVDDENAMLARFLADIPVVVDADRLRGASRAIEAHGADVLILDDGFQHRRIVRDLDIVLIDALWPFGAGHLLPRGLLREPLRELRRADFLLIARADLVTPGRLSSIKKRLAELAPRVPTACSRTQVHGLRPVRAEGGAPLEPTELRQGQWAAFCGVGNPEGFGLTLEKAGCRPEFLTVFADHQRYTAPQVQGVLRRAREAGCDHIVTTEKDAAKVEALLGGDAEPGVYALQTDLDFTEGSEALTVAILGALGQEP